MTIDERLEALTQSVGLVGHVQRETDERIRHIAIVAEQNEARAAQMIDASCPPERDAKYNECFSRILDLIENHERRIQ